MLFCFSMGIKVSFQCYLRPPSEARDLTHVIRSPKSWTIQWFAYCFAQPNFVSAIRLYCDMIFLVIWTHCCPHFSMSRKLPTALTLSCHINAGLTLCNVELTSESYFSNQKCHITTQSNSAHEIWCAKQYANHCNQDCLHFLKAKFFVGMYCSYSIFTSSWSVNLSELLTMIYESPAYLSLKSQKERLAPNTLKNYKTLLEISLGST